MRRQVIHNLSWLICAAVNPCAVAVDLSAPRAACGQRTGPDLTIGQIPDTSNYTNVADIDAFSVGPYYCNIGNTNLSHVPSTNQHPVVAQHMYRYRVESGAGRLEQIGISWAWHTFSTLTSSICGCVCNGQAGVVLGVGCSSPDSSAQVGTQLTTIGGLGPRFDINPHSGFFHFPYPFRNDNGATPVTSITRRLQVKIEDLNPPMNPGAQYFVEIQMIAPDDAAFGNQNNNCSHSSVRISGATPNFTTTMLGATVRESPAILAWQAIEPSVVVSNIDTPELEDPPASDKTTGRLILAANATDLGDGRWHYEYALFNMNSDRAVSSFAVPLAAPLSPDEIGFHDVFYHSGDGYGSTPANQITFDGTDWPALRSANALAWSLVPTVPIENSNAIRWGTLYNFRFDADAPPATGRVTLGLFKNVPGLPDSITAATVVPCSPGDLTGDSTVAPDDISPFVDALLQANAPCAADTNRDSAANGDDISPFVAALLAP